MGCTTCKDTNGVIIETENKTNIILRVLYFIIGVIAILILLPIVGLIGVYMVFNTIVLNKSTEIMPSLNFMSGLLQKKKEYDSRIDEDEFIDMNSEDFNPDDYELVGVEEIQKG